MTTTAPTPIATHEAYMARIHELCGQFCTDRAPMRRAWEQIERELEQTYGKRRYRSYAAFMAGKARLAGGFRLSR